MSVSWIILNFVPYILRHTEAHFYLIMNTHFFKFRPSFLEIVGLDMATRILRDCSKFKTEINVADILIDADWRLMPSVLIMIIREKDCFG